MGEHDTSRGCKQRRHRHLKMTVWSRKCRQRAREKNKKRYSSLLATTQKQLFTTLAKLTASDFNLCNKPSSAGSKSWRQTTAGSNYSESSLNRSATVFISIYLFPGQICKISHRSSFAALKRENISTTRWRRPTDWLTVFTFTPSSDVCFVVRLKPSILLARSPTTAGLEGSGEKGSDLKKPPDLIRAGRPAEVTPLINVFPLCSAEKSVDSALSWTIAYSVGAFGDAGAECQGGVYQHAPV